MMDLFFVILWVTQIITESLPISSSTHTQIAAYLFEKHKRMAVNYNQQKYNMKIVYFSQEIEHLMHIPNLIVFIVFLISYYLVSDSIAINAEILIKAIAANVVTVFFYYLFKYCGKKLLSIQVGIVFTLVMLISLLIIPCGLNTTISLKKALLIGAVQGLALLPGISRLGMTYVALQVLNITPEVGFVFSLLLQVMLIIGALLKTLIDFNSNAAQVYNNFLFLIDKRTLLVVSISTVISFIMLLYAYQAACKGIFYYFGFYMIIPLLLSLQLRD